MLRRGWALAALGLVAASSGTVVGCRQPARERKVASAASTPATQASSAASVSPDLDAILPSESTPPEQDWRRRLKLGDFRGAFDLLEALPDDRKAEPLVRLVLGVAATESERHAVAMAALSGLEEKLPDFAAEISAHRMRSAAVVGPYSEAAAALLATGRLDDALEAAHALQRGGDLDGARRACDRALVLAERARRGGVQVRVVRAELAELAGDRKAALSDFRWVLKEHPEAAWPLVSRLDALGSPPSVEEKLSVYESAATTERLPDIRRALDDLQKLNPNQAPRLTYAWGKALLRARRFAPAAKALEEAAGRLTGPLALEARYHAARAMARSGREAEAASRFEALAVTRPTTLWTTRAVLRLAETQALLGRYTSASRNYSRYLSGKKKLPDDGATYGRALALLGAGKGKDARKALARLRERASPKQGAFLYELEGVAAEIAGDRKGAVAIWLELVRNEPLTWPAWMASARLASVGHASTPPPIGPPTEEAAQPLDAELPPAVARLASLGLDGLAAARLIREEEEVAKSAKGRENELLCALHGQLTTVRRRMQIGERAVKRTVLMRPPSEAELWCWQCVYPAGYAGLVADEERRQAIVPGLVHGVMRQESAFDENARSAVGARGLMQLMPTTAARAAEEAGVQILPNEIVRPEVNVRLGAHYLAKLLHQYGDNPAVAAAAYNAGPHAVHSWLTSRNEAALDLWVARIPFRETRNYVASVVGNMLRYQYLAGGVPALVGPGLSVPKAPPLAEDAY